jgi:hypothetical protein
MWRGLQTHRRSYLPEGELVLTILTIVIANYLITADSAPYYIFAITLAYSGICRTSNHCGMTEYSNLILVIMIFLGFDFKPAVLQNQENVYPI